MKRIVILAPGFGRLGNGDTSSTHGRLWTMSDAVRIEFKGSFFLLAKEDYHLGTFLWGWLPFHSSPNTPAQLHPSPTHLPAAIRPNNKQPWNNKKLKCSVLQHWIEEFACGVKLAGLKQKSAGSWAWAVSSQCCSQRGFL